MVDFNKELAENKRVREILTLSKLLSERALIKVIKNLNLILSDKTNKKDNFEISEL